AARRANGAIELPEHAGLAEARRPAGAAVALAWVAVERYDVEAAGRLLRGIDPKAGGNGLGAGGGGGGKSRRGAGRAGGRRGPGRGGRGRGRPAVLAGPRTRARSGTAAHDDGASRRRH